MKIDYYMKTYRLNETEAKEFRNMLEFKNAQNLEPLSKLAKRWITEIRQTCKSEVACRAVMFRFVLDAAFDAGAPEEDRVLAVTWAQLLTDKIQRLVEEQDCNDVHLN